MLERCGGLSAFEHRLPLSGLYALGPDSASLMLRQWLHGHQVPESRLIEFLDQLAKSDSESRCELAWANCSLRLFRDYLYLSEPADFRTCPDALWKTDLTLDLGEELGSVKITGDAPAIGHGWAIGPRRSGARIRFQAEGPSRKLKKVLQEHPVPPWQRMSIPILYQGDEILAVGDWHFSAEFSQWLGSNNLKYRWLPQRNELCETQARCHALDPCRTLG